MGIVKYSAVIIGDKGCGKTRLLGGIVDEPHPLLGEQLVTHVKIPGLEGTKTLYILDTILDIHGEIHRPCFHDCDLSILVYAIDDPISLQNIERFWMPQVRRRAPNKPVILIGNKVDLRTDPETIARLTRMGRQPVSYEEGCYVATKIGACVYVECSAQYNINVQIVTKNILEILEKTDEHIKDKEIEEDPCICRIS